MRLWEAVRECMQYIYTIYSRKSFRVKRLSNSHLSSKGFFAKLHFMVTRSCITKCFPGVCTIESFPHSFRVQYQLYLFRSVHVYTFTLYNNKLMYITIFKLYGCVINANMCTRASRGYKLALHSCRVQTAVSKLHVSLFSF